MVIARSGGGFGPPAAAAPSSFSTAFPGVENPLNQGGIWQRGASEGGDWHDPYTTANGCFGPDPGASRYADPIAHLKTSYRSFAANQWAEGTVYRAGGYTPPGGAKHEIELHLRWATSSGVARGYELIWGMDGTAGQAYVALVKWEGAISNYTPLYDPGVGSIAMPASGDVLRAEISGNLFTAKLNGSVISGLSAYDVTAAGVWATGQPGLGFWPVDGSTPTSYGWASYRAGDL